jgi:membrane associated rhomboid family serine protease
MSIYDRPYMGDSDDAFGQSRGPRLTALSLLIIVNIIVWVLWQFAATNDALAAFMSVHFTCSPAGVLAGYVHTLLTSTISQQDIWHIFFNMLFLWFLGRDVQQFYGSRNFAVLYCVSGIVASAAFVGVKLLMGEPYASVLGASGAVMGITVIAAILDPNRPIYIYFIIRVPLKWLVAFFVISDILGVFNRQGMVANASHLGGAAAGALFWWFDLRLFASHTGGSGGLLPRLQRWWRGRRWRVIRKARPSVTAVDAQPPREEPRRESARSAVDAATARRVDELLAKISREGIGALNDDERAFLKASSEKYRK